LQVCQLHQPLADADSHDILQQFSNQKRQAWELLALQDGVLEHARPPLQVVVGVDAQSPQSPPAEECPVLSALLPVGSVVVSDCCVAFALTPVQNDMQGDTTQAMLAIKKGCAASKTKTLMCMPMCS
jgi:hypothetical protein